MGEAAMQRHVGQQEASQAGSALQVARQSFDGAGCEASSGGRGWLRDRLAQGPCFDWISQWRA
jgi:hypothetical protein